MTAEPARASGGDDREVVLLLTTFPAASENSERARILVQTGRVACIARTPGVRSTYLYEGRLEESEEEQWVMKTTRGRARELLERAAEWHPYAVPELLVVPIVDGLSTYMSWVADSCRSSG